MVERPIETEAERVARRRKAHGQLAAELAGLSDSELLRLVSDEQTLELGHTVVYAPTSNAKVFVKLVSLTAREMLPENRRASANLFRLPSYYQYRVGHCGGSAWRELQAQECASDWVLRGQSACFPLLHHWRILPIVRTGYDDRLNVGPWGGCPAIRERLREIGEATSSLVMFIEYFPLTLTNWVGEQLLDHAEPGLLVARIERALREHLGFIEGHGLLHLDAHFDNILTDGDRLYLADFGLALSREFQLDADEVKFFERHKNFDACTATNSLVHAIVTHYNPAPDWRQSLRDMDGHDLSDSHSTSEAMPSAIRSYLERRAPLALMVGEFYARLLKDCATPYPAAELQELLDRD